MPSRETRRNDVTAGSPAIERRDLRTGILPGSTVCRLNLFPVTPLLAPETLANSESLILTTTRERERERERIEREREGERKRERERERERKRERKRERGRER